MFVYCESEIHKCVFVCVSLSSKQLYQWSDHVVRTVVRSDWKVRSGYISKTAHMIVTPAVTVGGLSVKLVTLYIYILTPSLPAVANCFYLKGLVP